MKLAEAAFAVVVVDTAGVAADIIGDMVWVVGTAVVAEIQVGFDTVESVQTGPLQSVLYPFLFPKSLQLYPRREEQYPESPRYSGD